MCVCVCEQLVCESPFDAVADRRGGMVMLTLYFRKYSYSVLYDFIALLHDIPATDVVHSFTTFDTFLLSCFST